MGLEGPRFGAGRDFESRGLGVKIAYSTRTSPASRLSAIRSRPLLWPNSAWRSAGSDRVAWVNLLNTSATLTIPWARSPIHKPLLFFPGRGAPMASRGEMVLRCNFLGGMVLRCKISGGNVIILRHNSIDLQSVRCPSRTLSAICRRKRTGRSHTAPEFRKGDALMTVAR
jgi:hypothetical protein